MASSVSSASLAMAGTGGVTGLEAGDDRWLTQTAALRVRQCRKGFTPLRVR